MKIAVMTFAVCCIVTFYALDLGYFFTLENLQRQQGALYEYYSTHQTLTLTIYAGIYILATALSLPGAATALTLAGGAIFGFLPGLILVSFASTIGATLAFLAARFVFRDWVQSKFGEKLRTVNEGVEKEGSFYLFTLRLVPIFPFFLVNIVMALTPMKVVTFYWVSQVGMLAGTAAYVNAGTQLSQLHSIKGILSAKLLISFAIIGVLPLISQSLIKLSRSRKMSKHFKKPASFDYNVVVIGAGAAGLVSAYISAAIKAKVALIEKHKMGGDCLNTGCVPSKALIRSAKILSYIKRAKEFGFESIETKATQFDFAQVMERVQRVIKKVEPHDSMDRYSQLGVDCIQGEAKLLSPYEIEVNQKRLTTRNMIIATGANPIIPTIPGIEKIK